MTDVYFLIIVLQVVNDITAFYMQTYNNFKTLGDERLKETLRVIQTGVSNVCFILIQNDSDLI